ncbi:hypothetical protein C0992_008980 [Termitomyces sp. T32_za158]|nr:hypothetical protein C0992_008980 [Termitomyces sp. T32_za158]
MSSKSARSDEEEESGPEDHASLENVFRDKQGNPICFFLHKSIRLVWQRQNLTNEIQLNGGIVRPNDSDVDTVLVGQDCNKDDLQLAYHSHSDPSKRRTWVEPMSFVARCLMEGVVRHHQGSRKVNRYSSSGYVTFTHDDDEKLARYLAIRIPDIKSRGRGAPSVYKDLYRAYSADREEFSWVARHPWRSWRGRYMRNAIRFNDMIDKYVNLENPEQIQAYRPKRKSFLNEFTDEKQPRNSPKRRRVDPYQDFPENRGKIRPSLAGKGNERMVSEDASDTNLTWGETGVEGHQDRSRLTKEPHALVAPMSSAQISGIGASTKTVSTLLQHRSMARKTAQRDKPESAVIVSSVPSYPTGSRSRFVEPSILPSRLKTRQVGAAVGPSSISLPLLDESVNENDQPLVEVCSPDLIDEREILEEERTVEDLLVNDISESLQETEGESQIHMKDNPLIHPPIPMTPK